MNRSWDFWKSIWIFWVGYNRGGSERKPCSLVIYGYCIHRKKGSTISFKNLSFSVNNTPILRPIHFKTNIYKRYTVRRPHIKLMSAISYFWGIYKFPLFFHMSVLLKRVKFLSFQKRVFLLFVVIYFWVGYSFSIF